MTTLAELFQTVDLPEITGIDLSNLGHADIAGLLPSYGGVHPIKAIFIDKQAGKAYGIASGWDADSITYNGLLFKAGAMMPEIAGRAGSPWTTLGNHVEPVVAAFMLKMAIKDGVLYINGRNPCWGTPDGTGCYYQLPIFLEEGATLTVYNRDGEDFVASRPDRKFRFIGTPD